ncbi:MAG: bifunctional phosphopantothenoylcysteine decarboxylase/phosphopantothenate--cysteine ligase CoaBC [Deltaproteobacteria bacterium]|nr:bifunctional phosphopantothenoylcysteine decarboxylase/phosphopantothenate--cysteine ligase CoaBC [Deltaproteobacteria bacterium]
MNGRRVLLVVGGGIAAYKVPELVRALRQAGCQVRCALTEAAAAFVSPLVLQSLTGQPVRRSLLSAGEEGQIGHIELADWAELVLIAPASADLLARMAGGRAGDLPTAVLLATRAPLLAAPAMNVNMWEHPATQANVALLRERGVRFAGPESGELACGWQGSGRMSEPGALAAQAALLLGTRSLAGARVLVTAGGTRERLDAVRVLANRSSGKMGFAVAAEAARRGAEVVLVAAPCALPTPAGVRRVDVESALEMREAVRAEAPGAAVVVMSAAVADFRPARPQSHKIKKEELAEDAGLHIELLRNPDILAELCAARPAAAPGAPPAPIVVGFAAESRNLLAAARRKLARKGCDLLVANDIRQPGGGFESDENAVVLLDAAGGAEELPRLPKAEVAAHLWDRVEKLREPGL